MMYKPRAINSPFADDRLSIPCHAGYNAAAEKGNLP
jgi:hypothetical protein